MPDRPAKRLTWNRTAFDSIWITNHWRFRCMDHLYDEGVAVDSDHAVILADFVIA
jgi:hypothetical protein